MDNPIEADEDGSPSIFYSTYYERVLFGNGFSSSAVAKAHKSMELPYRGRFFSQVLEVGGGTGEHLNFISHSFDKCFIADVKLPKLQKNWEIDSKIIAQTANVQELPFDDATFDRVFCKCLFHLIDKPEIVME
jgi:phosphatidylethanolamine/phosphatidyl-N-methylethanolamine N-methyltransferase